MNAFPNNIPTDFENKLQVVVLTGRVISTNENWSIRIRWTSDLGGVAGSFWKLQSWLIPLTSEHQKSLNIITLTVPVVPDTGSVTYTEVVTINSGIVPQGIYRLTTVIFYINEEGKSTLTAYIESDVIQFVETSISGSNSVNEFTLISRTGQIATPYYLARTVNPYLMAIADIQKIIDDIQMLSHHEVFVKSITQHSPISVSLDGAAETLQLIKESVIPWRKAHAETMAHLLEQEKQTEIEVRKAEVLEKRAHAEKDRVDAAKQREEAKRIKLENEKLRLELQRARIQLAIDLLTQVSPTLQENERIEYLVKLLPSLDSIIFSELEVEQMGN